MDFKASNAIVIPSKTKEDSFNYEKSVAPPSHDWHEILPLLKLQGMTLAFARHCILQKYDSGKITLLLDQSGEQLHLKSAENELKMALEQHFDETLRLIIYSKKVVAETPLKRMERKEKQQQQSAIQSIHADHFIQVLQTEFGAKIIPGSIKSK